MTTLSANPVVATRKLSVGYGDGAVLEGVDLSIDAGEVVALVGGNGSGKTTLLRCLAGLTTALSGTIEWHGGRLPVGAARTRSVGVVFQSELAAPFRVRELVTLGLALDGPPGNGHQQVVDSMLRQLDLLTLDARFCETLSGGEWQRAVIGRALVASPMLLLLDEPTNHLDPAHRAALLSRLDDLRGVVAMVIATHDLDCAAMCDRVAVLGRRGVLAVGSPADVLCPDVLADALGVHVRAVPDPEGGPPLFRLLGPVQKESL